MGYVHRNSGYVPRTPELELLVCQDYYPGGKTLREISRERRLPLTVVHGILVERNVPRRPVGNHRKLKARRGPAYDSEVIARFERRQPLHVIAREMRTSRRLVKAVVDEYNLARDPLSRNSKAPEQVVG